jgi:hypothetical protein
MSRRGVESVLGRLILDADFRIRLLANPDEALAEFKLTAAEIARIKTLDAETLDALAKTIETRAAPLAHIEPD